MKRAALERAWQTDLSRKHVDLNKEQKLTQAPLQTLAVSSKELPYGSALCQVYGNVKV